MNIEIEASKPREINFGELSQKANLHEVSFLPVKNEVVWINHQIHFPLNIRAKKGTPLGVFADSSGSLSPKSTNLEYWPNHSRSALVARAYFADAAGRIYRDIDVKGIGAIRSKYDLRPEIMIPGRILPNGDRYGLMYERDARHDSEMAEFLTNEGVRTHRSLAITRLKEIAYGSQNIISVKDAKKRGAVDSEKYAIQVRAYGTKARLAEYIDNAQRGEDEAATIFLQDAMLLVSKELGLTSTMSVREYWSWFDETYMENLNNLQKLGITHGWLTPHNITLDARFVDLDDARFTKSETELRRDRDMARETYVGLIAVRNTKRSKELEVYSAFSKSQKTFSKYSITSKDPILNNKTLSHYLKIPYSKNK